MPLSLSPEHMTTTPIIKTSEITDIQAVQEIQSVTAIQVQQLYNTPQRSLHEQLKLINNLAEGKESLDWKEVARTIF